MVSLRQDPYLWWHLAGAATLPLWLDGCLAGLAAGDPVINVWVEQGLLLLMGITLPLALQWLRPLYLFRIGPLAMSAEALTEVQLRLLTLQRHWRQKGVAVLTAATLGAMLVVLYRIAPIAAPTTPLASMGRTSGWLLCAGCFLMANWFGQTAMSALGLLLAREKTLQRIQPHSRAQVSRDFAGVLIQVGQVLPKQWLQETPSAFSEAEIIPPIQPEDVPGSILQDSAEEVRLAAEAESLELEEPSPEPEEAQDSADEPPSEAEIVPEAESESQPTETAHATEAIADEATEPANAQAEPESSEFEASPTDTSEPI